MIKQNKNLSLLLISILLSVFGLSPILAQSNTDDLTVKSSSWLSSSKYVAENDNLQIDFGDKNNESSTKVRLQTTLENDLTDPSLFDQIKKSILPAEQKGIEFSLREVASESNTLITEPIIASTDLWSNILDWFNISNESDQTKVLNQDTSFTAVGSSEVALKQIQNNIDLHYQAKSNGLKESIVLTQPTNTNVFVFDLTLDSGLKLTQGWVQEDNGLMIDTYYITDSNDHYLFHFSKPFAIDSNDFKTEDVSFRLDNVKDNQYQITLKVNSDWLSNPDLQYPVTIDPTIVQNDYSTFQNGLVRNRMAFSSDGKGSITNMPGAKNINTVGLWHMDETSGTSVADSSGKNNTGTATGTTIVDGKFGKARQFNGTSDYVTITDSASLKPSNAITISTWIKLSSTTSNALIFDHQSASPWYGYGVMVNSSGKPSFDLYTTALTTITANTSIVANQWYHLAFVYDGSYQKIYINGRLDNSVAKTASINYSSSVNPAIGGRYSGTGNFFPGQIDELKINSNALTEDQIRLEAQNSPYGTYESSILDLGTDYSKYDKISWSEQSVRTGDGETPYSTNGLVAQWNFNEASGTTLYNMNGSCGANCNGTLTSFTNTTAQDTLPGSGWTYNNRKWGQGALNFDGDDYVSIPNNISQQPTTVTVESWINYQNISGTYGTILSKGLGGGYYNSYTLLIRSSDSKAIFSIANNTSGNYADTTSSIAIPKNEWVYIVGTYDQSTIKIYINGVLQGSTNYTQSIGYSTHPMEIGRMYNNGSGSQYFKGLIDSTKVYSRALSSDEILSNYNVGNIEIQTRSGTTSDPTDGSWEDWKPTGTETLLDGYDNSYLYSTTETGLVSYYPMDELNGSMVGDAKGTNNGTATGTKIVDGKFGKARSFNGTNSDYVEMPYNSNIDFTSNYSFSAWVYRSVDSGGYERLVTKANNSDYDYWFQITPNDEFQCGVLRTTSTSYDRISSTKVPIGQWTLLSCTFDSSYNWNIYQNGVLTNGTITGTAGPARTSNKNIEIGRLNSAGTWYYGFNGMIDEVRLYNNVISASQIFSAYEQGINRLGLNNINSKTDTIIKKENTASQKISQGTPLVDGNTVALWHLDETGGTGEYLKDSSGNNYNYDPNGTTSTSGISGNARNFNGSNVISRSHISTQTQNITFEGWLALCKWMQTHHK